MALELVDAGLRLWIHPVASGDSYSWTPDGFESFEWSPDGKHLAVFAEGAVRIHDTRGREIAALTEQLSPKDQGNTVISTWSPDSHWVAALSVDERDGIRLLSLEGESRALPVPDGIEGDVLLVLEWVDDSRVQLFHMRPGVREGELDTDAWTRDISDSASNWEPSSATEPARWVTPEEAERVKERAAPGTRHVCTTPTADRGGVVYAFMPEDAINLSSIVVERDGNLTDITAPEGVLPFSLRPCVSVVLAP
jgi:hypothetical protein